jgi:hypothetical protein
MKRTMNNTLDKMRVPVKMAFQLVPTASQGMPVHREVYECVSALALSAAAELVGL